MRRQTVIVIIASLFILTGSSFAAWIEGTQPVSSGFTLPYSGTCANNGPAFSAENTGNGDAIKGKSSNVGGVVGESDGAGYSGVYGANSNTTGYGVFGRNTGNSSYGYLGGPNGTGVYGETNTVSYGGVRGLSTNSNGNGIIGIGNNSSYICPNDGSGVAGIAANTGVYGTALTNGDGQGGYFSSMFGGWARVGAKVGGTNYKIYGGGNVSTVMPTDQGKKVLFAPECPEPFFEDFGQGRLSNGYSHIELDPLFLNCIKTDAQHPMKVFIQLNDNCNGVYVKTGSIGFDVYELRSGTSNAAFSYRVIANRKDTDYLRLPPAAPELEVRTVKTE